MTATTFPVRRPARLALGALLVAALAACGSETVTVPEATQGPLLAGKVTVKQTGDAPVQVRQDSISISLDNAKLLQVSMAIHSTAATRTTVALRASFYNSAGQLVGDATGGQLDVAPGQDITVHLSGLTPNGTISSATVEASLVPSATPLAT